LQLVISRCPSLNQVYHPPLLWGKCGHIQTAIYGKKGRWNCPWPEGTRHAVQLENGVTFTYDVFQPLTNSKMELADDKGGQVSVFFL